VLWLRSVERRGAGGGGLGVEGAGNWTYGDRQHPRDDRRDMAVGVNVPDQGQVPSRLDAEGVVVQDARRAMVPGLRRRTGEVVQGIHHGDDDAERQHQRRRQGRHEACGSPQSMLVHA
jgi:hypothetical protein